MSNGVNGGSKVAAGTDPAGRSAEQIQLDIRHTRSQLDHTLEAILQRLSPGGLVDEALDYLRHSGGREFAHNLNEAVKRNPVPITLMGIGLAWLMLSGREGRYAPDRAADSRLGERMSDMAGTLGGMVAASREQLSRAGESIGSAGSSMRERFDRASDRATQGTAAAGSSLHERTDRLRHTARERAARLSDSARHGMQRARGNFDALLQEQPLLVGALGIAVGVTLGSLLPPTRQEDEAMGAARDRLTGEVERQARLQLRKGKRIAQAAGDAARQAGEEELGQSAAEAEGQPSETAHAAAAEARQSGSQPQPGL